MTQIWSIPMAVLMTVQSYCEPICGDGHLVSPWEQCDDGNTERHDGCSDECDVEFGYECPLNSDTDASPDSICGPDCGDGFLRGDEICDVGPDGNQEACPTCLVIEPDFDCDGAQPTVCTELAPFLPLTFEGGIGADDERLDVIGNEGRS